jgi:hypothetical protein
MHVLNSHVSTSVLCWSLSRLSCLCRFSDHSNMKIERMRIKIKIKHGTVVNHAITGLLSPTPRNVMIFRRVYCPATRVCFVVLTAMLPTSCLDAMLINSCCVSRPTVCYRLTNYICETCACVPAHFLQSLSESSCLFKWNYICTRTSMSNSMHVA